MSLRNVAIIRKDRGVIEAEGLEMREADESIVTLDGGDEREGELDELGQLDAFEVDRRVVCEWQRPDEDDARSGHAEALSERCLRREEVTA